MENFLTYKKLTKPVQVQTASKEIIWFPGIGTVAFTTTVQGQQKKFVFHKCYYLPSGDKRICSLQWLTTQLGMTYKADAKTTQVFDSHGHAFLEGTRLLPQSNLHWFIGKPNTQTGALGLHMDLDIKSLNTVNLMTIDDKSFNNYKLWHACLGHPASQTLRHVTCTVQGVSDILVPSQVPICSDCQIGKKTKHNFPISLKCATASLQLVHCDLVEFPVESYYRHRYCLSIYDDYSGLGTCLLLRAKSDTSCEFAEWVMWAEN